MAFWLGLVVALALMVVSYLIMPKPKREQPSQTRDFEAPTADASRPVPVVFGTLTVKGPNVVWYGDKSSVEEEIKA